MDYLGDFPFQQGCIISGSQLVLAATFWLWLELRITQLLLTFHRQHLVEANEEASAAYNRAVSPSPTRFVLVMRVTVQYKTRNIPSFQNKCFSLQHHSIFLHVSPEANFWNFDFWSGNKTPWVPRSRPGLWWNCQAISWSRNCKYSRGYCILFLGLCMDVRYVNLKVVQMSIWAWS